MAGGNENLRILLWRGIVGGKTGTGRVALDDGYGETASC